MASSDEDEEDEEWAPSEEEGDGSSSSGGESSEAGGGQAAARARTRKRKATTAKAQSGRVKRSKYRGLRFHEGRWQPRIKIGGQYEHLGVFDSEEAAARAYDERAKKLHKSPVLNFLPDGTLNPNRKSDRPLLPDPGRPSIYRGVSFYKGRWQAQVSVKGQVKHLGGFDSEKAAARAYDARAKALRKAPILNFLPDGSLNADRKELSGRPALPDPGRPSIYRGVRFDQGRWVARISVGGQYEHLGVFDSEEAAARAYGERAKELYDSPVLNFLPDGSLNPDCKQRRRVPAGWRAATAAAAAAGKEDERTVAIEEEAEQRPRKRQRLVEKEDEEEDARTVAIEEEPEGATSSGSSRRRRGRGMMVVKKEEDERTVAIKEEREEDDARTVAIKEEKEEGDIMP